MKLSERLARYQERDPYSEFLDGNNVYPWKYPPGKDPGMK
jgi:hypothetical protein